MGTWGNQETKTSTQTEPATCKKIITNLFLFCTQFSHNFVHSKQYIYNTHRRVPDQSYLLFFCAVFSNFRKIMDTPSLSGITNGNGDGHVDNTAAEMLLRAERAMHAKHHTEHDSHGPIWLWIVVGVVFLYLLLAVVSMMIYTIVRLGQVHRMMSRARHLTAQARKIASQWVTPDSMMTGVAPDGNEVYRYQEPQVIDPDSVPIECSPEQDIAHMPPSPPSTTTDLEANTHVRHHHHNSSNAQHPHAASLSDLARTGNTSVPHQMRRTKTPPPPSSSSVPLRRPQRARRPMVMMQRDWPSLPNSRRRVTTGSGGNTPSSSSSSPSSSQKLLGAARGKDARLRSDARLDS